MNVDELEAEDVWRKISVMDLIDQGDIDGVEYHVNNMDLKVTDKMFDCAKKNGDLNMCNFLSNVQQSQQITLDIPLPFLFRRNPDLALPIIPMEFKKLRFNIPHQDIKTTEDRRSSR